MPICPICGADFRPRKPTQETCSRACGGALRRQRTPWQQRFWEKVDRGAPDDCWLWRGATQAGGYGSFGRSGRTVERAHRISWELANGRAPTGDVRHICDNPSCVNPRHLVDGTTAENIWDAEAKGRARHPRGAENGRATLTDEQVRAIRSDQRTQQEIANAYGINQTQVSRIKSRRQWGHVHD